MQIWWRLAPGKIANYRVENDQEIQLLYYISTYSMFERLESYDAASVRPFWRFYMKVDVMKGKTCKYGDA